MRAHLFYLLILIFCVTGKVSAQTIMTGNTTYDAFAPLGNDWKMAAPGNTAVTIRVYPNPVTDYLTIAMPYMNTLPLSVCLYDAAGKVAYRNVLEPGTSAYKIDMRTHANGTYFLKLDMHDVQMVRKVVLMAK